MRKCIAVEAGDGDAVMRQFLPGSIKWDPDKQYPVYLRNFLGHPTEMETVAFASDIKREDGKITAELSPVTERLETFGDILRFGGGFTIEEMRDDLVSSARLETVVAYFWAGNPYSMLGEEE